MAERLPHMQGPRKIFGAVGDCRNWLFDLYANRIFLQYLE